MTTPEQDATEIKRILSQVNMNEQELIQIVANRPRIQRLKIREAYKSKNNAEIIEDIVNKVSSSYADSLAPGVELLFEETYSSDVKQLYLALRKSSPPDIRKIIEIICTKDFPQIKKIKEVYYSMYDRKLDDELSSALEDDLQKIFSKFLTIKRSTNLVPDKESCRSKAKEIIDLKTGTWGEGDSAFVDILSTSSSRELILICRYFNAIIGKTLPNAIDDEFSGDLCKLLKEILFVLCCPSEFLAKRINETLLNDKPENCTAFNIILSREETDLPLIKKFYNQLFGKPLETDIMDLYKRDDKKFLIQYLRNY
ncbi:MAG: annexin [archaeon]|nr:annexin [archaeon]